MEYDDFPPISEALINALEARCPERWPQPGMSQEAIFFRAGQLNIIEVLSFVHRKQTEESMKGNITT